MFTKSLQGMIAFSPILPIQQQPTQLGKDFHLLPIHELYTLTVSIAVIPLRCFTRKSLQIAHIHRIAGKFMAKYSLV